MIRKRRNKGKFKSLFKQAMQRTPTLAGCLFLLYSVALPFCSTIVRTSGWARTGVMPQRPMPLNIPPWRSSTYYWSFMSSNVYYNTMDFRETKVKVQQLFLDYWGPYLGEDSQFCMIVFFMFIFQILALVAAISSVLVFKKSLAFAPFVLCLLVIGLMISACVHLSNVSLGLSSYEEGYLLSYLSMFLFLFGSILMLTVNRNKKSPRDFVSLDQAKDLD